MSKTESDQMERWQTHLTEALSRPGDTIALISSGGGLLVSQVRYGSDAIDLVHAARTLLELADERLAETRPVGLDARQSAEDLRYQVEQALAALPDPNDDEDEDDE